MSAVGRGTLRSPRLGEAQKNAAIAGVENVRWREGTATDLPFENDTFDITLSSVGHVFANPPGATARELLRVTRSGGRIAFTSWTPSSVVPAMGRVLPDYLPANTDVPEPPFLWGDPGVVRERLGDAVNNLEFETGTVLTPRALTGTLLGSCDHAVWAVHCCTRRC